MGYEIAGGLGVKMADPRREVIVMVGDGSYLMLNSEIATSVMLGLKLTIVCSTTAASAASTGCRRRSGGAPFNNLLRSAATRCCPRSISSPTPPASGAIAEKVAEIAALEAAVGRARGLAAHPRDRHRNRSGQEHRGRRRLVGRGRAGGLRERRGRARPRGLRRQARRRARRMSVRFGVSPIAWTNDDMPELGGETPWKPSCADAAAIGFAGVELGGKFSARAGRAAAPCWSASGWR